MNICSFAFFLLVLLCVAGCSGSESKAPSAGAIILTKLPLEIIQYIHALCKDSRLNLANWILYLVLKPPLVRKIAIIRMLAASIELKHINHPFDSEQDRNDYLNSLIPEGNRPIDLSRYNNNPRALAREIVKHACLESGANDEEIILGLPNITWLVLLFYENNIEMFVAAFESHLSAPIRLKALHDLFIHEIDRTDKPKLIKIRDRLKERLNAYYTPELFEMIDNALGLIVTDMSDISRCLKKIKSPELKKVVLGYLRQRQSLLVLNCLDNEHHVPELDRPTDWSLPFQPKPREETFGFIKELQLFKLPPENVVASALKYYGRLRRFDLQLITDYLKEVDESGELLQQLVQHFNDAM